jgi:hypothetical protein
MQPMSTGAKRRFRIRLEGQLAKAGLVLCPPAPNTTASTLREWWNLATTSPAKIRAWDEEGAFTRGFGVFYPDGTLLGFVVGADDPLAATPSAWGAR